MPEAMEMQPVMDSGLQRALDVFADCFDLRLTVFDSAGHRILTGGQRSFCRYCTAVRRSAAGRAACDASDRELFQKARESNATVSHICHAGLLEAVRPVMVYGRPSAYIMLGQLRVTDRQAQRAIPQHLMHLLQEKTGYPPSRVRSILTLFDILVHHIMDSHLLRFRTDEKFQMILAYLRHHYQKKVTVDDLAKLVGVCRTSVANMFSRYAGQGFKQVLIRMRLDTFEHLLRERPALTIKEAAAEVGYDDALFFSRLYQTYRGEPPSAFRKRCAKEASGV